MDGAHNSSNRDLTFCGLTLDSHQVSPDEFKALEAIHGYAGANRIDLTAHALRRLRQRGGGPADAVFALVHATICADQRGDPGRAGDWRVTGPDTDGDDLTCAVILDDGVLVVTVF